MKLHEAIHRVDALCPNTFSMTEKLSWISEVEGRVHREILRIYEGGGEGEVPQFDEDSDPQTELAVCAPYDGLYLLYLQMQMDYCNGETGRHNNSAAAFEAAWRDYAAWYNRTHVPRAAKKIYW